MKVGVNVNFTPKLGIGDTGEVQVWLYSFLTSSLTGLVGQRHAPAVWSPEESPSLCCRGLSGIQTWFWLVGKTINLLSSPEFKLQTVQSVTSHYTDDTFPASRKRWKADFWVTLHNILATLFMYYHDMCVHTHTHTRVCGALINP